MKILSIFLLSLFTCLSQIYGQCFSEKISDYHLQWTAFKTPKKEGVKGHFQKIDINNLTPNIVVDDLLKLTKLEISIDAKSSNTGNPARDKTLKDNFFTFAKIEGRIIKIDKNFITLSITINNKTKNIPLKYLTQDNVFTAKGHIDILDFALSENLKKLNKACFALHEGKTWSDVEIDLSIKLVSCS